MRTPEQKAPRHRRVVSVVTLLWNGSGACTIMMAQAAKLADVEEGEAAYYAAQPLWFVVATDLALGASVAAAVAPTLDGGKAR